MKNYCSLLGLIASCLISVSVSAELLPRAGGTLVYDTVQDITWFADANYALTIGHNPDGFALPGFMTRSSASQWINTLDYAGVSDWRLPTTTQPDPSCSVQSPDGTTSTTFNCIGSELGYMFYVALGGTATVAISAQHNSNYNLFANINDYLGYYWADPLPANPLRSWAFRFDLGYQNTELRTLHSSVWPVRDGDILLAQPPDGDINTDGYVDAIDVQLAMQIVLGNRIPTPQEFLHADVAPMVTGSPQPDGTITTGDLVLIIQKASGVQDF